MNVTWQPPITPNGIVKSYRIMYSTRLRCFIRRNSMIINDSESAVINNLEIFTTYQIQVFATTITEGNGSDILTVKTDEYSKYFNCFFVNVII